MNIQDTAPLKKILQNLTPDATPLWGKMSPQHVVEHLITSLKISTGKRVVELYLPEAEAAAIKSKIVYSDAQLTQGIKSPILGDEPPALVYSSLDEATNELFNEIEHFGKYYNENPTATHTHPRMGELSLDEWLTVHNKHFTHHLKQYGLV